MNLPRTPTAARKGNRYACAGCSEPAKDMPIRQEKAIAENAPRRNSALRPRLVDYSCTGTNRRAKPTRALAGTPAYEHSRRARYRIEALFAELKQRMHLGRVRLRRVWNVAEQFLLAATAQNLKRLVRFLAQRPPTPSLKVS